MRCSFLALAFILLGSVGDCTEGFPTVQAVPLPNDQIAFEIDGEEVARYYAAPDVPKP
jgi:hypothetical protein